MADPIIGKETTVISVDPGESCGVTIFEKGKFNCRAAIHGDDLASISRILRPFDRREDVAFVIERQFGKMIKGRINLKSLETLYRRRFVWEVAAQIFEIRVVLVYPATWQALLAMAPSYGPKGGKRSTKWRAKFVATHIFGDMVKGWSQDEIDAAMIGYWYVSRQKGLGLV